MKWLLAIVATIYIAIIVRNISFVAGGPDESGYMNEARMLASGHTHIAIAPLRTLHLDNSFGEVFTPLGFSPRPDGTMVPVYPPGYPIHLLVAAAIGGWSHAPFFIVPLAAFASIVLMYAVAREFGLSPPYAIASAAILAAYPTFVVHSIVVMSDVLAMFWALLAMWLAARMVARKSPSRGSIFSTSTRLKTSPQVSSSTTRMPTALAAAASACR